MTKFDRFAEKAEKFVAQAWFFAACVLIVVVWIPTTILMEFETSQLLINTLTTIVTFLLVALIQNAQRRFENAVNEKLNAQSKALAEFVFRLGHEDLSDELRKAVGLEKETSA